MICPRCQHAFQERDFDVVDGICPACGIAWRKWLAAAAARAMVKESLHLAANDSGPLVDACTGTSATPEPWWRRLYHYACFVPSDRHESAFWGHLVLYILFVAWGLRFVAHGVDYHYTGASFLHSVNLPFHEYGHVMFSPFGTFWMFLGGSLFQILLPLFPLAAFLVWQRDNFAASVMLWWSGQNFLDVAPYIADAPLRAIPLINGNDDAHDWWNLLSMSNALDHAGFYANLCFLLGVLVILLSNAWGGHLLWIEFRGRTSGAAAGET